MKTWQLERMAKEKTHIMAIARHIITRRTKRNMNSPLLWIDLRTKVLFHKGRLLLIRDLIIRKSVMRNLDACIDIGLLTC